MLSSADKRILDRALAKVIKDYKRLDDAEYILTTNLGKLKMDIDQYTAKVRTVINFGYSKGDAKEDISKAIKEFYKNMKGYLAANGPNEAEKVVSRLLDSVLAEYQTSVEAVTSSMASNLFQKSNVFKKMSEVAKVTSEKLAEVNQYEIVKVTIGDDVYQKQPLENLWKRMNDSYGTRDTVQYRPSAAEAAAGKTGKNYPLRSYVDMRTTTTSADTHRTTTEVQASASGILFGQIDRTGTADSCIYHENEIVFFNDAAREIAIARFPDIERFKTMRTVQEIKADDTHMFKPACRHKVNPIPLQYQDNETIHEDLKSAPMQPVPKKINEAKIFEDINGKKHRDAMKAA